MSSADRPHLLEDLAAPVYMAGVGGAILGSAAPALYALRKGKVPGIMPVTTGAVLGELGGNVLGGGYGLYRRGRREARDPSPQNFSKRSNTLAKHFAAGAVLDLLLGGNPDAALSGALGTTLISSGLSGALSPTPGLAAARAALPASAALGAGIGASRLAKKMWERSKSSGALDTMYDVSYVLPDEEIAEGVVRVPLGKIPLLRQLFDLRVKAYGGASVPEIVDAAIAGGADLPKAPTRTLTGFETLHGYRPRALSVSKTSAARVWYRLRSA